jgi:hypothetical protein
MKSGAPRIAIGSAFYPSDGADRRRQMRARDALLALTDAVAVHVQFHDDDYAPEGLLTRRVLRLDSRLVTGAEGRRKPIVSEMFDALAAVAHESGARYFAYINADIEVTPAAIDYVLSGGQDGYAFSRVDVDPETDEAVGIQRCGIDMVAIDAAWWGRERRRFRPYIAGEAAWDNVYAAILCSHGRADVVNHRTLIRHERHPMLWKDGPFAEYNGFLAALDHPYFSQWVRYIDALEHAPDPEAEHNRLIQEVLGDDRRSAGSRLRHAGRQMRARWRYARRSRSWRHGIAASRQ